MNDKIREFQKQIEEEKRKISKCKHDFDKSFYNAEPIKEGYGSVQDGAGSDPHWSYAGYRDVKKTDGQESVKYVALNNILINKKT